MSLRKTIRYAFADTSLGSTLVAASDPAVVAIHLGDDHARLISELEAGSRMPSWWPTRRGWREK